MFWAPDSVNLGLLSSGTIKCIDIVSGVVRDIAKVAGLRGVSWGTQKTMLVGTLLQGIVAVPANGGTPVPVTRPQVGDEYHYYPHFLPDGDRFFLFHGIRRVSALWPLLPYRRHRFGCSTTSSTSSTASRTRRVGRVTCSSRGPERCTPSDSIPIVALEGPMMVVASDGRSQRSGQAHSQFSASHNGRLVTLSPPLAEVTRVVRTGQSGGALGAAGPFATMTPAPNGRKAVVLYHEPYSRAFRCSSSGPQSRDPHANRGWRHLSHQVWSPDGTQLVYSSLRESPTPKMYTANANGGVSVELLGSSPVEKFPWHWTEWGLVYEEEADWRSA